MCVGVFSVYFFLVYKSATWDNLLSSGLNLGEVKSESISQFSLFLSSFSHNALGTERSGRLLPSSYRNLYGPLKSSLDFDLLKREIKECRLLVLCSLTMGLQGVCFAV